MAITATYSPEDNKIRLYASERLDAETFARVKQAGFKWAPKQELFVAPKWTIEREDLALELAGEIEAEEMTLAERAALKAERLEGLSAKRAEDANAFQRTASELARAFEFGQPILAGHHSERKARKTQEKIHNAMNKAVQADKLSYYWLYRANSVQHHANRKNDPRTRRRRIKTLLAELRDHQRAINKAHRALDLWQRNTTREKILVLANIPNLSLVPYGTWSDLSNGKNDPHQVRKDMIELLTQRLASPSRTRWISHILHRLSYERELLGEVPLFDGEITLTTLQMFAREHGAEKPKATKTETGFCVTCAVPLPRHIGDGCSLELPGDEWRSLMRSCGYIPPVKKPSKPPILNFKSPTGVVQAVNPYRREFDALPQASMTKAEYSKISTAQRGTRLSACGQFRVRIAPNPNHEGPRYMAGCAAIFIEDQKAHAIPESALLEPLEAAQ